MTDETQRLNDDPDRTHLLNGDPEGTQRLEDAVSTQRLTDDPERTQHFDVEADNAETYVSFGPGVPMPVAPPAPDRATALWRGEITPSPAPEDTALARRRRTQRWILPLTVLILVIAVLIYFFLGRSPSSALAVTGVTVKPATTVVNCGGTERLTAELTTNGGSGAVEYQWLRSDGTVSDHLTQPVAQGERHVSIVLEWSFEGYGTMDATATFSVLSPGTQRAVANFAYRCVK